MDVKRFVGVVYEITNEPVVCERVCVRREDMIAVRCADVVCAYRLRRVVI